MKRVPTSNNVSYSEFGEIDPDKVKAAVKTFTHSCAGYSVATYVLVSDSYINKVHADCHCCTILYRALETVTMTTSW